MLIIFELGSSTFLLKLFRYVIAIATEFDDFSCIGFSTTCLFKLCLHFMQCNINETKCLSPCQENIFHLFHAICMESLFKINYLRTQFLKIEAILYFAMHHDLSDYHKYQEYCLPALENPAIILAAVTCCFCWQV